MSLHWVVDHQVWNDGWTLLTENNFVKLFLWITIGGSNFLSNQIVKEYRFPPASIHEYVSSSYSMIYSLAI